MSYLEQLYTYLIDRADNYNYETIEYTKILVERLDSENGVIHDFFMENDIDFNRFLEEAMSLAEYRLKKFGQADLSRNDFEEVLDFLVIETDVSKLYNSDHLDIYETEDGKEIYIPDQFAVDFFKEKYDVDLDLNKPFDYHLFYEKPDDPIMELMNNVCLN